MLAVQLLLFPFGSSGDVHPIVGLGLAMQSRGHQVTLATNGYFRELVERVGLEFVEITTREDFLRLAAHPDLWHPLRSPSYLFREGVSRIIRPQYELIAERYQPGETVVVANCFGAGARVAQDQLGVPLVTVHLQPAVLWSEYDSPKLGEIVVGPGVPRWFKRFQFWLGERLFLDPAACGPINAFRRELQLPPMRRVVQWWNSPDCVLGLFPEWYAPPQPDWPANVHLTQFPLWDEQSLHVADPELEAFLGTGAPPIVFTPGSGNMQGREFFAAAIESCQLLGRRGLLLTRFPEQLPATLPAGVRHFSYVPFTNLLPRCAAIVHHGGIGTVAQALAAGIPQLVMPLSHDQPDNAHRLRRFGVGDWLRPRHFRGRQVAEKLRHLLASAQVAADCRLLADRFKNENPFEQSCRVIEQFHRRINNPQSTVASSSTH